MYSCPTNIVWVLSEMLHLKPSLYYISTKSLSQRDDYWKKKWKRKHSNWCSSLLKFTGFYNFHNFLQGTVLPKVRCSLINDSFASHMLTFAEINWTKLDKDKQIMDNMCNVCFCSESTAKTSLISSSKKEFPLPILLEQNF